jgi:hypothetical protein
VQASLSLVVCAICPVTRLLGSAAALDGALQQLAYTQRYNRHIENTNDISSHTPAATLLVLSHNCSKIRRYANSGGQKLSGLPHAVVKRPFHTTTACFPCSERACSSQLFSRTPVHDHHLSLPVSPPPPRRIPLRSAGTAGPFDNPLSPPTPSPQHLSTQLTLDASPTIAPIRGLPPPSRSKHVC